MKNGCLPTEQGQGEGSTDPVNGVDNQLCAVQAEQHVLLLLHVRLELNGMVLIAIFNKIHYEINYLPLKI